MPVCHGKEMERLQRPNGQVLSNVVFCDECKSVNVLGAPFVASRVNAGPLEDIDYQSGATPPRILVDSEVEPVAGPRAIPDGGA